VIYTGSITNATGADLTLEATIDFLASPGGEDYSVVDLAPEFLATDLIVSPAGYSGPLFSVQWTANAPNGLFGSGQLVLFPEETVDPEVSMASFTDRVPGVGSFCLELLGLSGNAVSLAVDDSTNTARIAFLTTEGGLFVATSDDGDWIAETVDAGLASANRPSLLIDGDRFSHVAYFDGSTGDLKHATDRTGAWVVTSVDTAGIVGEWASLARDDLDRLHISYYDRTNGVLKHALYEGGAWTTEVVDAASDVGAFTSIALDASAQPRIAYYDVTNSGLKLASFDGSAWSTEIVDDTGDVGTWTAIAVAGATTFVAYRDETNSQLRLAFQDGGGWMFETIDADGDPGVSTAIDVDFLGRAHVTYVESATGELRYALRATAGLWESGVVADPTVGTSMSLSAIEEPFVAYVSDTGALFFAALTSCETVSAPELSESIAGRLLLRAPRPNPFATGTVISFDLGMSAETRVQVFDAAGRLVAGLLDAKVGPGLVRVDWDGRDRRGHPQPAGVYWYQVRAGDLTRSGRLVLIR
jgi:hypothetical protein